MRILKIILILLVIFIYQPIKAQLTINELMAANSSIIYDPDFDESSDWVEIYNNSSGEVNLSNYSLTDNLDEPGKWSFPSGTTIPAHGFLIIWADGQDTGLHTSFKLSSDGEEIGLFDENQNMVDSLVFPAQKTNISYGRHIDGASSLYWFSSPSPASSNNASTPFIGITYYEPKFSIKGGFYQTEQWVELSSISGEIHYTTDGSTPAIDDPLYSQAIPISHTTFLRARVFQSQHIPGPIITHSYFFDDSLLDRELPIVSLVCDDEYFWDDDNGIYVQDFKPEWEYPINIELFENNDNNRSVFNEIAGVKVNGKFSWQLPQKMLGIYFRKEYGNNSLDYPVFDDRERNSYNEIILRASGSDWSETIFRDGLAQEMAQENTHIPHQGFRPSIVFINGEYLGIHNIRSRIDDGFIETTYDMESGSYDLIKNEGEIEEGSDEQYLEMETLFNNDLSIESNFQSLSNKVDLENFTNYWITQIWSANYSWGHNINYWKPKEGGKWQFIFADLDRAFIESNYSITEFAVPSEDNYYDFAQYWFESIFQNEEYAQFFVQRFNDHIFTSYHPQRLLPLIDEFAATIDQEIPYHVDKYSGTTSVYGDGIESVEFWEEEVEVIKEFAQERHEFIMEDLQEFFGMGPIHQLQTNCIPNNAGNIYIDDFTIPSQPWQGPYFQDMTFQLKAETNPGFEFQGWNAIFNTSLINLEDDWKYHDLGEDLGSTWKESDFDDSSWSIGQAELGYGDEDENTIISYGGDEDDKYITSYFRKSFEYQEIAESITGHIKLRRDDGIIVYLNGTEIIRNNMPEGDINYRTRALENILGSDEDDLIEYTFEDMSLESQNVIAVEIHQISHKSGDISFDLSFTVSGISNAFISTEEILDISLESDSGFIANYQSTDACLLPLEITENTSLSIDCSPYLASGDLNIMPNISLSIDPGVEIWFPENAGMRVQGDLQVNGSESQPVIFKANQEYGADSWNILLFDNASSPSHLTHLEIRDASTGLHPVFHKAAISIFNSEVIMDHLLLDDNFDSPIYAHQSNISLNNSLLHSKVTGDLINVKYGDCIIDNCHFIGNEQVDTDAIDYDGVTNGIIRNSTIEKFYGSNSDGIDLGEDSKDILIENCHIDEITDKGISIGQSSTAIMLNNTITYCNLGIGIKDLGEGIVNHNTFYANVHAASVFEKNIGAGGGFLDIKNSILSNSSKSPIKVDDVSIALSEQNIYDNDAMLGASNQWMNPQFSNPDFYNFQLLSGSGAINAGLDGEDLGAPYSALNKEKKVHISDLYYFHPWNVDKEFIRIHNSSDITIDISNYQLSIGIEFTFPNGTQLEANEKILIAKDKSLFSHVPGQLFEWTSGKLSNEGEKVVLLNQHGIIIDHIKFLPEQPWPVLLEADDYISLIADSLDNHFGSNWTIGEPLAISEYNNSHHQIEVFPIPCSELLNLRCSQDIELVQIFDISGRELIQSRHSSSKIQINVESLEPGVYFSKIDNEQIIKFVKE
ncbi:T9SS type A sorting domain-containing protein [Lentimicrobium sp. L6]|uniref:lamin tail domain-containing protein n=1 Tax=Lentimicrobium sp. L6 TaxID=2735916 RepID=UPI001552761D|nr:lamin tail domain-containing protein [Lentimicrobium sp. L6]NPD84562.1 T9SS type A sorting domain-containing protein [Lentimicrobium sp. L6]